MSKKNLLRILADAILFLSVFIAPWWFIFGLAILLAFYFRFYIESVLFVWAFDILYSGQSFLAGADRLTLIMLVCFVVIQVSKEKIIFYK